MVPSNFSISTTPGTFQGQRLSKGCSIDWKRMAMECPSQSYAILDEANREGFSTKPKGPVDTSMHAEVQQLHTLQDRFKSKLSRFTTLQRSLVDGARAFVDSTDKHNPFLNKNVQLSSGPIGYVTTGAIFKPYPNSAAATATMGRNGCPSTQVPANVPAGDYASVGATIPTTPPLIVGTPMTSAQPCFNFGKNVRVGVPDVGDADFLGVYDYSPVTDAFAIQKDLGSDESTMYQNCQRRAADLGSGAFGLGYLLGPDEGIHCAAGPTPTQRPKEGQGLQDHVGWSKTFNQDISTFGLKPDASVFTVYGDRPLWSAATRTDCGAGAGGSMISDVLSTYGANCNSTSTQSTSNQ